MPPRHLMLLLSGAPVTALVFPRPRAALKRAGPLRASETDDLLAQAAHGHRRARLGQEGHRRQGQLHDRRGRWQEQGQPGPDGADPRGDEPHDVGLRHREAARAPREDLRRCRPDHGRRGYRSRDEGEEGPRRRRPARDTRSSRRGPRRGSSPEEIRRRDPAWNTNSQVCFWL